MKPQKPLTREAYLKKFSRAARWRLPPQESEEAIADYRELVFQPERDESKLVEELGAPVQAAHLLTDVKTYRRWLKLFAVLTFGLFLLAWWSWTGQPFIRIRFSSWDYGIFGEGWRGVAVLAVGLVLTLYWFRRHGQKNGRLSKWLLLLLAVVLIFGAVVLGVSWRTLSPEFLATFAGLPYEQYVGTAAARQIALFGELIIDGGTLCPFIALAGLVLAKCRDRRWLSLYTLALTAAVLCFILESWAHGMDVEMGAFKDVRTVLFPGLLWAGAAGLVGTGVALC